MELLSSETSHNDGAQGASFFEFLRGTFRRVGHGAMRAHLGAVTKVATQVETFAVSDYAPLFFT